MDELTKQLDKKLVISGQIPLNPQFVLDKATEYVLDIQFVNFSNWMKEQCDISPEDLKVALQNLSNRNSRFAAAEKVTNSNY